MVDLLRRAWDALNTFKQTYPENWHEEDEQVLKDLMRADLKLSGVEQKVEELEQRPWVGLTDEPTYTEQQIANACWATEISDSKCESLLIALQEAAYGIKELNT